MRLLMVGKPVCLGNAKGDLTLRPPMLFHFDRDFLDAKFRDHRIHRRNMWIIGGLVGSGFWAWDYLTDPIGAQDTWVLRLLVAVVAWIAAAVMHFPSASMLLVTVVGIGAFWALNAIFFLILMNLHDGMIYGIAGFVFLQMGLLVFQGFSMMVITFAHLSVAALPHIMALALPGSNFLHAQYAMLIWPAAIATIISHYTLHHEYHRSYKLSKKLEMLARTDPLTGAFTRRFFEESAQNILAMARRTRNNTAIMVIDADHFKRVNDTYGHAAGDDVLRVLSGVARRTLRETDLLCRWGGEEFVALLPETDLAGAIRTAERLLVSVRETDIPVNDGTAIRVTISIGLALVAPEEQELAPGIARADEALYRAKSLGRNQVQCEHREADPQPENTPSSHFG